MLPFLALTAFALLPAPQTATPSATPAEQPVPQVFVEPVPLPDAAALSAAQYKAALTALLNNAAKRPGVYASLVGTMSRDTVSPHAPVIVELMSGYLVSTNPLEAIVPLKVIGMCGKAARPAMAKVLPLATSPIGKVRLGAAEALGGMYYAPKGTAPTCPASVTKVLTHMLQYDMDRGTKRAAAVALGRARVATPEVVLTLAGIAGSDDVPVALGGLSAVQSLGTDAKLALPAIKKRLGDKMCAVNAAEALIAVASPQEAGDAFAQALTVAPPAATYATDAAGYEYVRNLLYFAERLPRSANTALLAAALQARMQPAEGADDLRLSAARAHHALTGDTAVCAATFAGVAADTAAAPTLRRDAVTGLAKIGAPVLTVAPVLPALQSALDSSDSGLQSTTVAFLNKVAGPAAKAAAPCVSSSLLKAWKAKRTARVCSLLNVLYRMGPVAKVAATPVLKTIIAADKNTTASGQLAQTVLDKLTAPSQVSAL